MVLNTSGDRFPSLKILPSVKSVSLPRYTKSNHHHYYPHTYLKGASRPLVRLPVLHLPAQTKEYKKNICGPAQASNLFLPPSLFHRIPLLDPFELGRRTI